MAYCIKCHHHKKMHEKLFLNNHEYAIYDNANVSATWHHFTPPKPPSNHIKAHLTVAAYAGAYTYTYFPSTPFNITTPKRNW